MPTPAPQAVQAERRSRPRPILNMRLAKLTGLEIAKLEAELKEVRRPSSRSCKRILGLKPRRMKHPEGGDARRSPRPSETTAAPRSSRIRTTSRSRI